MDCRNKTKKTERPEATVPWNKVKGVSVNPEGEGRHEQVRAKITRKERKSSKVARKGRWKGTS